MNIFLEDKLQIQKTEEIKQLLFSNKRENQIMAVVYEKKIVFLNDMNQEMEECYKNDVKITKCLWHPKFNEIVIGNEAGGIDIYNPFTTEMKQDDETHVDEITQIHFSKSGEIMITNDKSNQMVFWIDINPVKIEHKLVPINKIIFVDFVYDREQTQKNIRLGFVGDKLGKIEYFEEKKLTLRELCQVSGSIKEMFFYKKTNSLIVITSNYLLIEYNISTEEDIKPLKKFKISMANSSEHLKGLWMSPNSFLLNSKENTLKIWNLEKNKNYQINLFNYISKKRVEKKLAIVDFVFDTLDIILYVALSNGEIIIFQSRQKELGEEASDWRKIGALKNKDKNRSIKKIDINKSSSLIVQYESEIIMYKKTNIKIFIEKTKNFKILQHSFNRIEFFINFKESHNFFDFPYKIKDFIILDESVVFFTTQRKIFLLPLIEVFNNAQKLEKMTEKNTSQSKDLKRYNKIEIENEIKKVILTKFGYCEIQNSKKLFFYNYKKELVLEYRISNRDEYLMDIITNSTFDKFATINNKYQMKIFATEAKNVKIIYENLDLIELMNSSEKLSLEENKINKESDFSFFENNNKIENNLQDQLIENSSNKTKFEKILINSNGENVILITNKQKKNLILKNIQTSKVFIANLQDNYEILNAFYDSKDDRFLMISVKNLKQQKFILILTTDGNDVRYFDKISIDDNHFLINSAFPSIFLSTLDENNTIQTLEKFPTLFESLYAEDNNNSVVNEFARNFCFYLSYEKLSNAVTSLKSIENNFEMKHFWESLLEISLKNKNVSVAELCLKNMKNIRITKLLEQEKKNNPEMNNITKLGIIALSYNKTDIAKKIFFEENLYSKVCEILFKEESYTQLIKFCKKYDKIFLNYYYFQISLKYLEKKNYTKFIEFVKKSKVGENFIIESLIRDEKVDLLENYANSENSLLIKNVLFHYYLKKKNEKKAVALLKDNKESNSILACFYLKNKNDFEKAKLFCQSEEGKNSVFLDFASHLKEKNKILDSIDFLMKGRYFGKIIDSLKNNKEYFENNPDIFSSVLDFVYNHAMQKKLVSINIIADYFLEINYKEKAIKLFIKSKNFRKAFMLAEKFNMNYLIPEIEKGFNERKERIKKEKENFKRNINSGQNFATNSKEAQFNLLLKNKDFFGALEFAKKEDCVYKQLQFDMIKNSDFEKKEELMNLIAKKWKKSGKYEKAINAYLELRQNIKVVKTMIKAQFIPKLIQFANFSRDVTVFELSANYLSTCSITYNDQIFKSICMFYSKSRNLKKLFHFFISFGVNLFEKGNLESVEEVFKKAEDLLSKIEEESKNQFEEQLNLEKGYLQLYKNCLEFNKNQDYENELKICRELIASYNKSKLYNYYNIYLRGLKCALILNNKEEIIELGSFLIQKKKNSFCKNFSIDDQEKLKKFLPDLEKMKNLKNDSQEDIEEELF